MKNYAIFKEYKSNSDKKSDRLEDWLQTITLTEMYYLVSLGS